ncbi:MAG: response regulator [Myxococcales bacterium]
MRSLVVEDDVTSRLALQGLLTRYGKVDTAPDGQAAVAALRTALGARAPYDLVCLDILMPGLDGQAVLRELRTLEDLHGIDLGYGAKVIMTSVLKDSSSINGAFRAQCDAYLVKPVDGSRMDAQLRKLSLVELTGAKAPARASPAARK